MPVISPWQGRAAAASSPVWRQPDLALDGYLTGVIIAPRPIPTAYWQGAVLTGDDLLLRDEGHARATREALVSRHAALVGDVDEHLARLERGRLCDYRPAFWPDEGAPSHSVIRRWAGGFSVAMALAPEAWGRLIEDERTPDLVVPFIEFFERDDPEFEPADDKRGAPRSGCRCHPARPPGPPQAGEAPRCRWLCHTGGVGFGQDRAQ